MNYYSNLSGRSNVYSYAIASDNITVTFNGGATYLYTYSSSGVQHVEQMKILAVQGFGLNSYIGRIVKKNYAARLR